MILIFLLLLVVIISLVFFLKKGQFDNYFKMRCSCTTYYVITAVNKKEIEMKKSLISLLPARKRPQLIIDDLEPYELSEEYIKANYSHILKFLDKNVSTKQAQRTIGLVESIMNINANYIAIISEDINVILFEKLMKDKYNYLCKNKEYPTVVTNTALQIISYCPQLQLLLIGEKSVLSNFSERNEEIMKDYLKTFDAIFYFENTGSEYAKYLSSEGKTIKPLKYDFSYTKYINILSSKVYNFLSSFQKENNTDFCYQIIIAMLRYDKTYINNLLNQRYGSVNIDSHSIKTFLDDNYNFSIKEVYYNLTKESLEKFNEWLLIRHNSSPKTLTDEELKQYCQKMVSAIYELNTLRELGTNLKDKIVMYSNYVKVQFVIHMLSEYHFKPVFHFIDEQNGRMRDMEYFKETIDMKERCKKINEILFIKRYF